MSRTIFRNANLLDGENRARRGAVVVVENDRIVSVGASGPSRVGDTAVDLRGLTLMPGMVTGHFHAAYSQAGDTALPMGAPETQQAYWALANAQTALRSGYTSVVGAGTFFDIDARLAEAIDAGVVSGPRFIPCSRALSPKTHEGESREGSPYVACWGPEAFREATVREIERGAKIVKLFAAQGHAMLKSREMTMDELRAAVDAARERGVRTRAHVAGRDQVLKCVRAGVDIIDHADGMDEECIDAILEHDCFVLPSLYMPYLTARDRNAPAAELFDPKDYEQMRGALPRAAAAGVKIVPGDDYGYGPLPHTLGIYSGELACYVEQVGVSPLEVLKWATRNGGMLTGVADLGTIAPGMLADMLIVDGDPSADITILAKPERMIAVIKGGQVVSGQLPVAQPVMAAE